MIRVVIGGDVCPVGRSLALFKNGDAKTIFNDLLHEFHVAELSIANLECPLIDRQTPINKIGPVLGVDSDCINGFTQASIDVINLANNHILDHGAPGLRNTIDVCAKNNIATVGAGTSLYEARKILIKEISYVRVGIIGLAEHEFSTATRHNCGANPLDLIDFARNVRSERKNFDYLIALVHGGNLYYPFASPRLRDTCRFLVDMGANTVIVQHTHCPGCYEEYNDAHIVYGQGNLIFDSQNRVDSFYEGFLARLSIDNNLKSEITFIPYTQSSPFVGARRMDPETERLFHQSLADRSLAIKDDVFVENQWKQFCAKKKHEYLSHVLAHNRFLRRLNTRGLLVKLLCSKESIYRLRNIITCESHREILETILKHYFP